MSKQDAAPKAEGHVTNFLRNIIDTDLAAQRFAARRWAGTPGDGSHHALAPVDAQRIRTRFPPEPNGYLHVGHAKSICLNFGLARDYAGQCHMRFDDTNPVKEDQEYVDTILDTVHWMGFGYHEEGPAGAHDNQFYASDYFDDLYRFAEYLIETGHAYVDQQSAEEMRASRGNLTERGSDSPWRSRPAEESLRLFREMRAGKHAEGSMILRAKIDMASPNMNLRDPALYRIRFADHHRTGSKWCIYPMYDFTHAVSDALENITHSICTLEFQDHRPLYDWAVERIVPVLREPQWLAGLELLAGVRNGGIDGQRDFAKRCFKLRYKLAPHGPEAELRALLDGWKDDDARLDAELPVFFELLCGPHAHQFTPLLAHALEPLKADVFQLPRQYEFARLNLTYVITSKRKLLQLVQEGHVDGWDDPRMPTIVGLRRRGYTPASLQLFAERIGVSKSDGWIDYATLEQSLRDDLDPKAPRTVAVLDPVKLVLTNWDAGTFDDCTAPVHPHHAELGQRSFPIGRELWIEREDFAEVPTKGFFRLFPGNKVRLKYGYIVECTGCSKDADGRVIEVQATVIADTKSGTPGADSVKVKGNITWVSAAHAVAAEFRLYDRLFADAQPDAGGKNFLDALNPASKQVVQGYLEPGTLAAPGARWQVERFGYFVADAKDSTVERPVLNRITTLKDSWGK
ncbi:glutamine--tRNA ligase [Derxia lacustris]|uniref:glutamine--tRNA ligase n=1 Tax=Derxia lacustris TaxID=764842 RepID=UPI000A16F258|nr:glutamine--tRNA ligase [Derxia lacustris]